MPADLTPAEAPPVAKSFSDPEFQRAFDAAFKNTNLKREGKEPNVEVPDIDAPPEPKKAPKPPEPEPEPDDEGDEEEPAVVVEQKGKESDEPEPPKSAKGKDNFERLRASLKEKHSKREAELLAQLEEAKSDKLLKAVEDERDALRKELQAIAVERDPAFQKEFKEKREAAIERLKGIDGKLGDKLADIAALPASAHRDAMIEEMIKDLPAWKQGQIGVAMLDLTKVSQERDTLIKRTQDNLQIEVQKKEREQQREQQRRAAAFDTRVKDWHEKFANVPDEVKPRVEAALEQAKSIYSGQVKDASDVADVAIRAELFHLVLQDSIDREKEIQRLREQVKALQGSQPKPGSGGDAPDKGDDDDDDGYKPGSAESPGERMVRFMKKKGAPILAAIGMLTLFTGCMSASYKHDGTTVTIMSLGRKVDLTKLTVDKKTSTTYTGIGAATYNAAGDVETIRAITEAAVAGAVRGARP